MNKGKIKDPIPEAKLILFFSLSLVGYTRYKDYINIITLFILGLFHYTHSTQFIALAQVVGSTLFASYIGTGFFVQADWWLKVYFVPFSYFT